MQGPLARILCHHQPDQHENGRNPSHDYEHNEDRVRVLRTYDPQNKLEDADHEVNEPVDNVARDQSVLRFILLLSHLDPSVHVEGTPDAQAQASHQKQQVPLVLRCNPEHVDQG